MKDILERKNGLMTAVERLLAFVGGVSGAIALGLIVFKGGMVLQLVQTVVADNAALHADNAAIHSDLGKLKDGATSVALQHIKEDNERDAQMRADIKSLQDAFRESTKANIELLRQQAQLAQKLDDWMAFQSTPKKGTP